MEDKNNIYYEPLEDIHGDNNHGKYSKQCLCVCSIVCVLYLSFIIFFIHLLQIEDGSTDH